MNEDSKLARLEKVFQEALAEYDIAADLWLAVSDVQTAALMLKAAKTAEVRQAGDALWSIASGIEAVTKEAKDTAEQKYHATAETRNAAEAQAKQEAESPLGPHTGA